MSSSEESPEALSDPLPRVYSCFCQKIFTTYPGIYLHLKSKHGNLFQRYKKLKITKLFKKIKNNDGSQIYKLDRLADREGANNNFSQKKIKQKKKRRNSSSQSSIKDDEEADPREYKRTTRNQRIPQNQQNQEKRTSPNKPPFQFNHEMFQIAYKRFVSSQPPPNPFFGFPHHPQHQFPQFPQFPHFPPFPSLPNLPNFPNFKSQSTIKKLMQGFLNKAQERRIYNLLQLKESLYDLMIFIDKNCELIPDPRIKQKIVFSYCDEFQPKYIGALLAQFIRQKQQEQDQEVKQRQIEYIINFSTWLKQIGLLQNAIVHQEKERQVGKRKVQLFVEEDLSQ